MSDTSPQQGLVDRVYEALGNVWDPELGIDIVNLGLIYDVRVDDMGIEVDMTLTTPGCPVSDYLPWEAREALARAIPEVPLRLEVVWDPPWSPARLSGEARKLGFDPSPAA